jgi:hypothetical protein
MTEKELNIMFDQQERTLSALELTQMNIVVPAQRREVTRLYGREKWTHCKVGCVTGCWAEIKGIIVFETYTKVRFRAGYKMLLSHIDFESKKVVHVWSRMVKPRIPDPSLVSEFDHRTPVQTTVESGSLRRR